MSHSYKKEAWSHGGIDKSTANRKVRHCNIEEDIGDGVLYQYLVGKRRKVKTSNAKALRK